jgi:hypothetical protein
MHDVAVASVVEAVLTLDEGVDPAAVGAAVTVALCGHWEHEPPCRWPHNNATVPDGGASLHRTLFVAPCEEADDVRARIEAALRAGEGWRVTKVRSRPVADDERALAERLLGGSRRL